MTVSTIELSKEGPTVSRLIPGFWRLAEWGMTSAQLLDWIKAAIDLGMTTFDHADIYGSYSCETRFGDAIAREPSIREKMQLVTKCGIKLTDHPDYSLNHYDTRRAHILESVDNSLRKLRTDRLDLLLIHRPDPLMDADEVAAAFTTLRDSGKVLHFGVSNFLPFQFDLLQSRLDFPLVTNQIEFSVLFMDPQYDGTVDQLQRLRIKPMIWSPLGGGRLFTGTDEQAQRVRQTLTEIGRKHNAEIDQIALAWLLMHPGRFVPVLGTGKIERLKSAAAAESITLTRQQWFEIWVASMGHNVP